MPLFGLAAENDERRTVFRQRDGNDRPAILARAITNGIADPAGGRVPELGLFAGDPEGALGLSRAGDKVDLRIADPAVDVVPGAGEVLRDSRLLECLVDWGCGDDPALWL